MPAALDFQDADLRTNLDANSKGLLSTMNVSPAPVKRNLYFYLWVNGVATTYLRATAKFYLVNSLVHTVPIIYTGGGASIAKSSMSFNQQPTWAGGPSPGPQFPASGFGDVRYLWLGAGFNASEINPTPLFAVPVNVPFDLVNIEIIEHNLNTTTTAHFYMACEAYE